MTVLPARDEARQRISEMRMEQATTLAPTLPWPVFLSHIFRWRQGEHVAAIGPTGSGKTTLAFNLLELRKYVVAFGTKPRDETLASLEQHGFKRMQTWENLEAYKYPKRLIWPNAKELYAAKKQQAEFRKAMAHIYTQGCWCLYVDELWFVIHHLRLELEIKTYLQQARSNLISLMITTQRPAFVPLEVYDQSTHLFFWRDNDERNLSRLSGISWLNANMIKHIIANLQEHELLYINTRTGKMYRTTPPKVDSVKGG